MDHQERARKTFCTTREAAEILGVSLRTAQLWVEGGLLEAWKTGGGHRRISRQSIERLLASSPAVGGSGAAAGDEAAAADGQGEPLSIMVIEDEAALRLVYELTLSRWPLRSQVTTAGDGYEGLIRMGHREPDLLITDLHMPGMDGFRMLQTLRALPEFVRMEIVVVTGLDADEIADRGGIPAGIPILPKPIPFDQLREIAERVAANRVPRSSAAR